MQISYLTNVKTRKITSAKTRKIEIEKPKNRLQDPKMPQQTSKLCPILSKQHHFSAPNEAQSGFKQVSFATQTSLVCIPIEPLLPIQNAHYDCQNDLTRS